MMIIMYPEDLPKGFKGHKKNPLLINFPQLKKISFELEDVVMYKYESETIFLKRPGECVTLC